MMMMMIRYQNQVSRRHLITCGADHNQVLLKVKAQKRLVI